MKDDQEPVRKSWFGMGGRPRLPYYLRADQGRRLKGLDEFKDPEWKGRIRWPEDDRVTLGGIMSDTMRWLAVFAVGGAFVGIWLGWSGTDPCLRLGEFTLGWC